MASNPKPKLLLIDDAAIVREPLAMSFDRRGFNVSQAANGIDGLATLKSAVTPFDLIILDYAMPEMDGIAFLNALNQYPALQQIPVIMLTDNNKNEIVKDAAALGVKGYLLKSTVNLDEIEKLIKEIISQSKLTKSTGGRSQGS
jgi:CheY-like chemotaxis protein